MNVYLDSSVVLRRLQREPAALAHWGQWQHAYSSVLLRVEVLRTIDRNRLRGAVSDREASELLAAAHAFFDAIQFVALSDGILSRGSQSFFTALGTLDALHLATALRLVEAGSMELTFLTHDAELALAARSVNFSVEGI
jgi:predicted nucleic acid-binding protein